MWFGLGSWGPAQAELNTETQQRYSTNLGLIRQESLFIMGFALFLPFFLKSLKSQNFWSPKGVRSQRGERVGMRQEGQRGLGVYLLLFSAL